MTCLPCRGRGRIVIRNGCAVVPCPTCRGRGDVVTVSSTPTGTAVPSEGGNRPPKGGERKTKVVGAVLDLLALWALTSCCCSGGGSAVGWPEAGVPTRGREPAPDVRTVAPPLTDAQLVSDLLPPDSARVDALFPDLGGALDLRGAEAAFPDVGGPDLSAPDLSTPEAPAVAVDALAVPDSRADGVFPDVQTDTQAACGSVDRCRVNCAVQWQGHPCRACQAGTISSACVHRTTNEGSDAVQTFLFVPDCSQCTAEAGLLP